MLRGALFRPLSRMVLPKLVDAGVLFGSPENTGVLVALKAAAVFEAKLAEGHPWRELAKANLAGM
jgi:hypothetical protein